MYQNKQGQRVTLYVRRIKHANADSMFQFTSSGDLKRRELFSLVNVSYQQLVHD